MSPGALHTELFIFFGQMKVVSMSCVDPSKEIIVDEDFKSAANDMVTRWPVIEAMLKELLSGA